MPDIPVLNRYMESDPTNQEDQVALLSRPGLKKWLTMATSPSGRCVYSQPGSFDEAVFNCAGDTIYKIAQDETVTSIGTIGTSTGSVSMTATDTYLFIADGSALYYYTENDFARGTLTTTGAVSAAETVVIGSSHYKFVTDITPDADGSSTAPWLVYLGSDTEQALQNLYDAISNTGIAGTQYSLSIEANPDAVAQTVDATVLTVRAFNYGTDGNAIATTETMANASWGGTTLSGGGGSHFASIPTPDGDGIISVGAIAQFVICVVAQGQDRNGRFYWIEPGEINIDALNFATAERSPDPCFNVVILGDKFWLPGSSTIEIWYPNGDPLAPFLRQQGTVLERGAWEGTIVPIGEKMCLVDSTGDAWVVTDAGPMKISTPGIAERLREAIDAQRAA